jgi:hypothetical protein
VQISCRQARENSWGSNLAGAKMLRRKNFPVGGVAIFVILIVAGREIYSENLRGA